MSIYRPAGYGPAPTKAEIIAHDAAQGGSGPGRWLAQWPADGLGGGLEAVACHRDGEGDIRSTPLCERDEGDIDNRPLWCALGPDGLPCAIGTPPETERERLDRATARGRGVMPRATRTTPYQRILRAAEEGKPCQLTTADCAILAADYAIFSRADADDAEDLDGGGWAADGKHSSGPPRREVVRLRAEVATATERAERAEAALAAADALADAAGAAFVWSSVGEAGEARYRVEPESLDGIESALGVYLSARAALQPAKHDAD